MPAEFRPSETLNLPSFLTRFDISASVSATLAGTARDEAELARDEAVGAINGLGIRYVFSTLTADADPGAGKVRLGSATQNTSVVLRADLADANADDTTAWLDALDDSASTVKGRLRLFKVADPEAWLEFDVTAVASPAGYRNVTIVPIASSAASPFADADVLRIAFWRAGDPGTAGVFTAIASQAEAEAGAENTKGITSLRTKQAITAQVISKDVVNAVRDHGADPTGVTGVLAAWNASLAALDPVIGGEIHYLQGTFRSAATTLADSLDILQDNVTIRGRGAGTVFKKTAADTYVIVVGRSGEPGVVDGDRFLNPRFFDFTVDGDELVDSTDDFAAVWGRYCKGFRAERVICKDGPGFRIGRADSSFVDRRVIDSMIAHCRVENGTYIGFEMFGHEDTHCHHNTVEGGALSGGANSIGFRCVDGQRAIIAENIARSVGKGFLSTGTSSDIQRDIKFLNNIAEDPVYSQCYDIHGPFAGLEVRGNLGRGSGSTEFDVMVVSGNTYGYAIDAIVRDNVLYGSLTTAQVLRFLGMAGGEVGNNNIYHVRTGRVATGYGILFDECAGLIEIPDNKVVMDFEASVCFSHFNCGRNFVGHVHGGVISRPGTPPFTGGRAFVEAGSGVFVKGHGLWTGSGVIVSGTPVDDIAYITHRDDQAQEIDTSAATPFGDMTAGGGLDEIHDDDEVQNSSTGAQKSGSVTTAYAGLDLGAEFQIDAAAVYPSTDGGFGSGTVTVMLRAASAALGAPANLAAAATHGDLIGTAGPFSDADIVRRYIEAANAEKGSLYQYVWVHITTTSANPIFLAELRVFEAISQTGGLLIDGGTNIGDLTAAPGLTALFDHDRDKTFAQSANKASSASAYGGKTWAVARQLSHVKIHGTTDSGFAGGAPDVTLELYGKVAAPAPSSSTDGVLLGTTTIINDPLGLHGDDAIEIESDDRETTFRHWWVRVVPEATATIGVAHLDFYGWA